MGIEFKVQAGDISLFRARFLSFSHSHDAVSPLLYGGQGVSLAGCLEGSGLRWSENMVFDWVRPLLGCRNGKTLLLRLDRGEDLYTPRIGVI